MQCNIISNEPKIKKYKIQFRLAVLLVWGMAREGKKSGLYIDAGSRRGTEQSDLYGEK